ncbi:hypothetical protein SteCoe_25436 [Stentor coeruleus]|uniref:Uncharacterized protein n=1 Tax=Stentor coeruleus TaxID=5963 RepID=A0A1R2BFC9_9CILI|nr:hypothetical protein SteCoe_25436 [Stentor coeruleus]
MGITASVDEKRLGHNRSIAIACKDNFEEWNLPDYEIYRLSRVRITQPKLKPLAKNDLYIKRIQRFGAQACQ